MESSTLSMALDEHAYQRQTPPPSLTRLNQTRRTSSLRSTYGLEVHQAQGTTVQRMKELQKGDGKGSREESLVVRHPNTSSGRNSMVDLFFAYLS